MTEIPQNIFSAEVNKGKQNRMVKQNLDQPINKLTKISNCLCNKKKKTLARSKKKKKSACHQNIFYINYSQWSQLGSLLACERGSKTHEKSANLSDLMRM